MCKIKYRVQKNITLRYNVFCAEPYTQTSEDYTKISIIFFKNKALMRFRIELPKPCQNFLRL